MILAINITILTLGVVLILGGFISFLRLPRARFNGINRIQFAGILTIETNMGSLFIVGFGLILLLTSFYSQISSMNAEKRIISQNKQLEAIIPSGAALTLVPFDQMSILEEQSDQFSSEVIQKYQEIQTDTFNQFLEFADDERFALMVLNAFDKNSFGLANISHERIPDIDDLLMKISGSFPTNIKLQLEVAKTYRSLYESQVITNEEKMNFLNKWGEVNENLKMLQTGDESEKYEINLQLGLYFQEKGELIKALGTMLKASEFVPSEEKYKTSYNLGNIYLGLALKEENIEQKQDYYEKSIERMLESEQRSIEQDIKFWQPRFCIGVVYLYTERFEESTSTFSSAFEIAEQGEEGKLFMYYLSKTKGIEKLCELKSFVNKFPEACEL